MAYTQGYPQEQLLTRFSLHSFQCRRKIDSVLWLGSIYYVPSLSELTRLKIRKLVARVRNNKIFELAIPRTNILLASSLHHAIRNDYKFEEQIDDLFSSSLQSIRKEKAKFGIERAILVTP